MAGAVTFTKDQGGWNREFRTPKGMVGSWLREKGNDVERLAKALEVQKGHAKTGRLLNSIARSKVSISPLGLYVEVEASAPYAHAHHEGYGPRIIRPKNGEVLVFPSNGQVVFTDEVHHPGYEGHPFLRNALVTVLTPNIMLR